MRRYANRVADRCGRVSVLASLSQVPCSTYGGSCRRGAVGSDLKLCFQEHHHTPSMANKIMPSIPMSKNAASTAMAARRAQTIQHSNTSASFIRRTQVTPRLSLV